MEKEKAIEYLNDVRNGIHIPAPGIELPLLNDKEKEAIDLAIAALEKQEAIKTCTPPSDDWEHYADRLHDIAYQSGYEQGKKDAEDKA